MNRRSIMVLLIGVIASLVGAATAAFIERGRCLDAGGRWEAGVRLCRSASGATTGLSRTSLVWGFAVGVLLAVMLYRTILFFAARRTPPR